jgi:hypothetical protein
MVVTKQQQKEAYTHFCDLVIPQVQAHWFKHYVIMKTFKQTHDQLFE